MGFLVRLSADVEEEDDLVCDGGTKSGKLCHSLNSGLTSNKPKYYLQDYGDFEEKEYKTFKLKFSRMDFFRRTFKRILMSN